MRMTLLVALASGLIGTAMAAEKVPDAQQASIPFVNHGSINDWREDGRRGLWIQDSHREWYYARFMEPCWGLEFAETIAFETRPSGTLDHFGSILVPREGHCQLQSLVRSGPPPKKVKP
jgi:Family of unknown function (DUF6491)